MKLALSIDTGVSVPYPPFFQHSAGSPVASSPSQLTPIRRRNNYTTESGPAFSQTTQFVPAYSIDRQRRYVHISWFESGLIDLFHGSSIQFRVSGKIDKGFFLADGEWACYRRNYFQLSTTFSCVTVMPGIEGELPFNPMEEPCVIEQDGQLYPVDQFKVCIAARVAAGEKPIGLIMHTSKRDKGPQIVPSPRPIRPGGVLSSNQLHQLLGSSQLTAVSNQSIVAFERVQFKNATANNGKRRAAQQHYVIDVILYAEVMKPHGHELIPVGKISSSPLIVRGRSPGHYSGNGIMQQQSYQGFMNMYPQQDQFNMVGGGNMMGGNMFDQSIMHMQPNQFSPGLMNNNSFGAPLPRLHISPSMQLSSPGGMFSPVGSGFGLAMSAQPSDSPSNSGMFISPQMNQRVPQPSAPATLKSFALPEPMSPFKLETNEEDRYGFQKILGQDLDLLGFQVDNNTQQAPY